MVNVKINQKFQRFVRNDLYNENIEVMLMAVAVIVDDNEDGLQSYSPGIFFSDKKVAVL